MAAKKKAVLIGPVREENKREKENKET